MKLKFLLSLLLFSIVFSRGVIGIDFGSEFIKVGLVTVGKPIDLVKLNN